MRLAKITAALALLLGLGAHRAEAAPILALTTDSLQRLLAFDGTRLEIRLAAEFGQRALILRERHRQVPPGVLAALGLSPREAQVLAWVAEGKTNGEIGIILGARPRTVAKHLERIFRKLGVETRTAAASALSLSAS